MAGKKHRKKKRKSKNQLTAANADRHILYEASVQCVEADLDFFQRVFRKQRGRPLRHLREDFCGTAALATEFVRRHRDNYAVGVDLDQPTLDWGLQHHVSTLGADTDRLRLVRDDVMNVSSPTVDLVAALNFSYSVFKDRAVLRRYFQTAFDSLRPDGALVLDAFGGTEAMETLEEERDVPPFIGPNGKKLPAFTYVWEQAKFNAINHDILCHIHFRFDDGTEMKRAFTYDWRLWMLPELQEVLLEVGFKTAEVFLEGWDEDEDDSDGVFRRRTHYDNMAGWVAYVVGWR